MIARVVVTPKPVVNDPQGLTVKQGLNALGFAEVADVRVGKYLEVTLDANSADDARERVEQMCRELLANHVIEDYRYTLHGENQGSPHGPPSSEHGENRGSPHEPPSSQSGAGPRSTDSNGPAKPALPLTSLETKEEAP